MTVRIATVTPRSLWGTDRALAAGSIVISTAAGIALAFEPLLALVPIAGLTAAILLFDGRARILFVVFGGLLVLQSQDSFNLSKVAFLGLFAVAFVGAFLNVRTKANTAAYQLARPLFAASLAFAALAALSLAVSHNNGTPLVGWWLRDIAPYLLFVTAPIFALDAQASMSRRGLVKLLITAGTMGALAFAVYWLDRRGIATIYASRIGLASHFMAAALFAYGMSATLHARRAKWLFLAGFVFALLLATGTRTTLVLVVAPLAIAFGARRHLATRTVRLALLGPIVVAITLAIGLALVSATGANEEFLSKRIDIFKSSGTAADTSYIERRRQAQVAWNKFESNPIVGGGPGTNFEWQTYDRKLASGFQLDTPLTFPAKFGLLGLAALAFTVFQYWLFLKGLSRGREPTVARLALVGYLAVVAGSAFAYSPFEDKGFSLGLLLMLALALADVTREDLGEPEVVRRGRTSESGEPPATAQE